MELTQSTADVGFVLDQYNKAEDRITGQTRPVPIMQEMTARALLVDTDRHGKGKDFDELVGAHNIPMDALNTDFRPALAARRESRGLSCDHYAAYLASGYQRHIAGSRLCGQWAPWRA